MIRQIFFPLLISLFFVSIQAQSKLDPQLLRMKLAQNETYHAASARNDSATIETFVTVVAIVANDADFPGSELTEMGVKIGTKVGRVATLQVPVSRLEQVAEMPAFQSIRANQKHQVTCLNSRMETGVNILHDNALASAEGLPQSYRGQGVMLGMVDTGIEYNHLNFINPETGHSRLRGAVLYRPTEGAAEDVREVYTETAQFDTLTTDDPFAAHGTHTSGVAAGSYPGLGLQGMAPEADLMLCGTSVLEDDRLIDALQQTFMRADALGEPCVVNLSIGNPVDWKDGKSPLCLACDALTEGGNAPGRVIVFSAGNDGNKDFTIDYQFVDTSYVYTLLQPYRKNNHSWYYNPNVVAFCSDSLPMQLDFALYDTLAHQFAEMPFEQHLLDTLDAGHDSRRELILDADTCDMQAYPNQLLVARIKGQLGSSVTIYYINNASVGYAMMDGNNGDRWLKGSPERSISDLCCTDAVLSVGAYSAVDSLVNIFGRPLYPWSPRNEVCDFSSYGHTWQGTPKPDVICPGASVISSYSSYYDEKIHYYYKDGRYLNSPMMYVVTPDGSERSYYWTSDVGTSLSSPILAGIIALWMQVCPTLSVNDIRQILQQSSRFDSYCADAPGGAIQAGLGKVDALAGMKVVLQSMPVVQLGQEKQTNPYCYDLKGNRLDASACQHGLFILHGKKVFVR